MMSDVHHAAQQGFESSAGAYARGRPDYPLQVVAWLTRCMKLHADTTAIDLGAGTGKFTRLLAATQAHVIAIEPVDAMRAKLASTLPAVQALAGTAQRMPLPDATADAVVCAQAFHWFATAEALAEIHRVLKPHGRLGLIWNVRDESIDWVAAITNIITPYEGDAPRFYKGQWRAPFDDSRLFTPLEETSWSHAHVGPPEDVIVNRFLSVSFIAALPDDERAAVAARLRALIATHPALAGRASIALPYRTLAYWCASQITA